MRSTFKPGDFVVPATTSAVLLSSSRQPSFVRNSTKFLRAAYDPARRSIITERLDPKDAPIVFNYNEYLVMPTSTGTVLSPPIVPPTTFILHRQADPSTWLNTLPSASTL